MDTNGEVTQQLEKPVEEQGTEITVETSTPLLHRTSSLT